MTTTQFNTKEEFHAYWKKHGRNITPDHYDRLMRTMKDFLYALSGDIDTWKGEPMIVDLSIDFQPQEPCGEDHPHHITKLSAKIP
jgi:hypothetical protein